MSRRSRLARQLQEQQLKNQQRKNNVLIAVFAASFFVLLAFAIVDRSGTAKVPTKTSGRENYKESQTNRILKDLSPGDVEAINELKQREAAGTLGTIPKTAAKTVPLSQEVAKKIWDDTPADIDRAIHSIETNLGPDQMNFSHPYMKSLSLHSKSWLMLHQIRAFGVKDWQLSFFEQKIGVSENKPFGSYMLEGHAGEIASTLLRVLPPNHKLKIRGAEFELWELALNKAPQYRLFPEENSFVLDALVTAHDPDSIYWERTEDMLVRELLLGMERYTKGEKPGTGACGALHFYDALSRFEGAFEPRSELLKKVKGQLAETVQSTAKELRHRLQQYYSMIEGDYIRFATTPDRKSSRVFSFDYTYVGHCLEIVQDPKGAYLQEFTDDELKQMAEVTAHAINVWFDPRFNPSACGMQQFIHVDESTVYNLHMGNLLHAYSGLKLYNERSKKDPN